MSHIIRFRVDGLAGRKASLDVTLNRDDNIFFGLNGCGKTSLLKILHAAMSNETSILARVPFEAAEVDIYSMNYDKIFTRRIKKPKSHIRVPRLRQAGIQLELMGKQDQNEWEGVAWTCSPEMPQHASSTRWQHEYLPTSRLHISDDPILTAIEYTASIGSSLTEDQLDTFFARSVEHLWSRYSAQVLGTVRTAQEQGLASILRVVLSTEKARRQRRESKLTPATAHDRVRNFLARQGSASILGTPAAFEKRYREDPMLQDIVKDIDSVEASIEKAMTSRNTLEELITRMFAGNKSIHFTDQSIDVVTPEGEEIGLRSLSSGEKHLLRILVQALLVDQNSLLIDEPEISLHVDWQRDLIQCMRALNPRAQFIFATHSPEVMSNVPDSKIFRL